MGQQGATQGSLSLAREVEARRRMLLLLLRATRASAASAAAARRKPTRLTAIVGLSSSSSPPSLGGGRRKGQRRGEAKPQPRQGETPSKKKPNARPARDKKDRAVEAEAKSQPRHGEIPSKKKPSARPAGDKKGGVVEAQGSQRQESELLRSKQQQQKPKRVVRWKCASGCGACCKLDKGPDFPTPEEIFADHPDDLQLYKSMIGSDGWCTNYDKSTRTCNIYQDRPLFCRVEPKVFDEYFGVPRSTFDREACSACVDTIKMVYGQDSAELSNFKRVIREESNKQELSKKQDKLLDT